MKNLKNLSPVLPAILTSLLDAEKDIVHVVSPYYSGLTSAFIQQGFKGRFEGTDEDILPVEVENACSVLVSIVTPYNKMKDNDILSLIQWYRESSVHKLYLIVFHNILFSNRTKVRSYRKNLLKDNAVEASIMLPERLLPDTNLGISLLILDNDRSFEHGTPQVKFIDASGLDVKNVQSLVDAGKHATLRDYIQKELNYARADCVSIHALDLVVHGEGLLASAHCLTSTQRKALSLLNNLHTEPLKNLVNFFRPLLPSKDGKGEKLKVLNIAQFSSFGYTKPEHQTDAYVERAGKTDQLIQPGDVLVCIRGSLGKVAIVSKDFSTDDPWIANSAAIILRPSKKEYDPRLLFLYLRSELGQELLKKLACGATVPMVQMNELKQLKVVLPSPEEAETLLKEFEEESALSEQIEALEQKRRELVSRHWSLSE